MNTDEMTEEDRAQAVKWMSERFKGAFPLDWLPPTGISVYDNGVLRAVAIVYFGLGSSAAVLGWSVTNPGNTARQSYQSVKLALGAAVVYARRMGAGHLLATFGTRSINRILDGMGFLNGDRHTEHKYKLLG